MECGLGDCLDRMDAPVGQHIDHKTALSVRFADWDNRRAYGVVGPAENTL